VVVVALLIAFVVMTNTFKNGSSNVVTDPGAGSSIQERPTIGESPETSAPAASHPAAEVKVSILNGSGVGRMATKGMELAKEEGFTAATAGNAGVRAPSTKIFVVPGYEADGSAIAEILGEQAVTPEPLPSPPPPEAPNPGDNQVIVVIGQDSPLKDS
jgi:hypothetical protein